MLSVAAMLLMRPSIATNINAPRKFALLLGEAAYCSYVPKLESAEKIFCFNRKCQKTSC